MIDTIFSSFSKWGNSRKLVHSRGKGESSLAGKKSRWKIVFCPREQTLAQMNMKTRFTRENRGRRALKIGPVARALYPKMWNTLCYPKPATRMLAYEDSTEKSGNGRWVSAPQFFTRSITIGFHHRSESCLEYFPHTAHLAAAAAFAHGTHGSVTCAKKKTARISANFARHTFGRDRSRRCIQTCIRCMLWQVLVRGRRFGWWGKEHCSNENAFGGDRESAKRQPLMRDFGQRGIRKESTEGNLQRNALLYKLDQNVKSGNRSQ